MNLLQQILSDKKDDLATAKAAQPRKELLQRIRDIPAAIPFGEALTREGFGIIAEIKRKSPSMRAMIPANVEEAPGAYGESSVVKAVSILTDWKYFGMRIEELEGLKRRIGKPVLRKDFIFDEYQVVEARAFGADAILLMAAVLEKARLLDLFDVATGLGMDVLFECHTNDEIDMIPDKARLYGINSRKFKTDARAFHSRASKTSEDAEGHLDRARDFSTDLHLFKELIGQLPASAVKVAESGLKPADIASVRALGFDGALIGASLLKSPLGVRRTLDLFGKALNSNPL